MFKKAIDNSCVCHKDTKYIKCTNRECSNLGIGSFDTNKKSPLIILNNKYLLDQDLSIVRQNIKLVLDIFNINNGYYVDVGAFEGFVRSNTYPLQTIGWSGICIEPIPHRNWGKRIKKSNGACILVKDVVYSENGLILDWAYTHNCGGVLKDNESKPKIIKKVGPTKTLDKILDENNAPKFINFIDIDTEGSDFEIIKNFPFDKYKFGIIMIEICKNKTFDNIKALLEDNNYILLCYNTSDAFFVNSNLL